MGENKFNFFESNSHFPTEKDTRKPPEESKGRLACTDFGFECSFMTSEDLVEKIIEEFREHTKLEHYTDYPAGILKKSL